MASEFTGDIEWKKMPERKPSAIEHCAPSRFRARPRPAISSRYDDRGGIVFLKVGGLTLGAQNGHSRLVVDRTELL